MGVERLLGGERNLGARFNLVNLLPSTVPVVVVLTIVWSGAPQHAPRLSRALEQAKSLGAVQALLLAFGVMVFALLTQPLQRSLVRTLEGYWLENPRWPVWAHRLGTGGQRRRYRALSNIASRQATPLGEDASDRAAERAAEEQRRTSRAAFRRSRRFPAEGRLLATALGNALRAAEDDAGQRYGLETVLVWPSLYTVLGDKARAVVDDQRTQLDVAARFSATLTVTAALAAGLLYRFPAWAVGAGLGLLALARLSYLAAVSAATAYGEGLRMAFDLHRFDLLSAMHLLLPDTSDAEEAANRTLSAFLSIAKPPGFHYHHGDSSSSDSTPGDKEAPGHDA